MSFFAFNRDNEGNILVSDQQVLEAVEIIVNQLLLLNARIEKGFER